MRKVEGAKGYGLCLDLLEIYDVPVRKREGFLCIYLILKNASAE